MKKFRGLATCVKTNNKSCLRILLVIVLIALGLLMSHDFTEEHFYRPIHVQESLTWSTTPGAAYVLLALGAQGNQMNCPAAVESLVRYGGWGGDVYFLTDRRSCFDEKEIVKNAGMDGNQFHMVDVAEDFTSVDWGNTHKDDPSNRVSGLRRNRVRSFAMNTRVFDYIRDTNITTVAYVDCDMLFSIDGCANQFISDGPSWDDVKLKFSHVYKNPSTGDFDGVHAGTFVAHRQHSKDALNLWRLEIEMGREKGDNDAFRNLFLRLKESLKGSQPSAHPLAVGEITPQNMTSNSWYYEKFLNPDEPGTHCMHHIPKARCKSYGRKSIQRFVDLFDLRTYEDGTHYCTHEYLQPLLYGWFPFKSLPFCPKLERLL